jgi:hypothetical protein
MYTFANMAQTHSCYRLFLNFNSHLPLLLHSNIFFLLWLFSSIGSILQEARAVKLNCGWTSGITDCTSLLPNFKFKCKLLFGIFQDILVSCKLSSSIVTVLLYYSGYNDLLPFSQVQRCLIRNCMWFFSFSKIFIVSLFVHLDLLL